MSVSNNVFGSRPDRDLSLSNLAVRKNLVVGGTTSTNRLASNEVTTDGLTADNALVGDLVVMGSFIVDGDTVGGGVDSSANPYVLLQGLDTTINSKFYVFSNDTSRALSNDVIGAEDATGGNLNLDPMFVVQNTNNVSAFTLVTTSGAATTNNAVQVNTAGLYQVSFIWGHVEEDNEGNVLQMQLGNAAGVPYTASSVWRTTVTSTDDHPTAKLEGYLDLAAGDTVTVLLSTQSTGDYEIEGRSLSLSLRKL